MKPKNVMLLGFVNKAVEYLDKNLEDETNSTLTELKNIDLPSLRRELSENLDLSLGSTQSAIDTLLKAGSDVFDRFIEAHNKKRSFSDELDQLFDVDFDNNKTKDSKEDLNKLMEYYHLDRFMDQYVPEETIADEKVSKAAEESVPKVIAEPENVIDAVSEKEEQQTFTFDDLEEEKEAEFEMSPADNELLQQIAENVNKVSNGEDINVNSGMEHSDLDSIFNELLNHEDMEARTEKKSEDERINRIDSYLNSLSDQQNLVFEKPEPEIKKTDLNDLNLIDQNDIVRMVEDIQSSESYYNETPVEKTNEEKDILQDGSGTVYLSSLIDELRQQMLEEDEAKQNREEELKQTCDRLHEVYPYLSNAFIRTVYEMKESIQKEYPLNENVVILHRVIFNDVENLRQFVEIVLNHGFTINADEEKHIVDVFKEYLNTDGKIISSIFEVANQCALLNGEYDGYRVISEE